eukprot:m.212108 g.212108  ORF g.212108 m.212108 type:complete len:916 (+) comp33117_c0_seq2:280-3027(+)
MSQSMVRSSRSGCRAIRSIAMLLLFVTVSAVEFDHGVAIQHNLNTGQDSKYSESHGIDDVTPVTNLLRRVVGNSTAAIFELKLNRSMLQGFTLETSGSPVKVHVTASGLVELTYGAGYYLRKYALFSFSWIRTGGNQVRPPPDGDFPHIDVPVTITKRARWSYYQNVCTQSYSMWWWNWSRWQQEIDWAALWGVNLVLAYTGQEQVFRKVYNDIGVNDSILNNTFDGPAFLTWSRGQGTFGVGGPLPNYWINSQAELQAQIVMRLRELEMNPILPGFQGNVPKEMPLIFPTANTSNGWLDALDPLFTKIASNIATSMKTSFGAASFIEADGWFSLETGPWLAGGGTTAINGSQEDSGSCLGGFVIPSYEEAFTRAQKVFSTLISANPEAVWIYQGYPWFRVYSQGASCNQTALRLFVKGFTDAIPENKLIVLDLVADSPGRALWQYPDSQTIGRFTQNASLIWCALNNWGGAVHIGGDMNYTLTESIAAMKQPNVDGVGLTPEGIDNSPAYFSLVLDSAWTQEASAESWLVSWGTSRCGKANVVGVEQAYTLLYKTVYRPGKPYLWCCSQPVFCPTTTPDQQPARPDYNVSMLRAALELMVEAADECNSSTFNYDLVDVAREWLSMSVCLDRFDKVSTHGSASELVSQVDALLEVYQDTDAMMATDEGFLLGAWLNNSRRVSDWDGSEGSLYDFYEWNSRVQISSWAGGYSRREWSGMVEHYYAERVKIWLNWTLGSEAHTVPVDVPIDVPIIHSTTANYSSFPLQDCNFDDMSPQPGCHGAHSCNVSQLESLCDASSTCIGFNYPGCYMKDACHNWKSAPGTTFYFKPRHNPPQPSSSCLLGFCSSNVVNGTYNGTTCDSQCPPRPPQPPIVQLYAAFEGAWQNETWTEKKYPTTRMGNPAALAKQLLAKYPTL